MADSFIAEELLTETNHEILRHLETCPVCRADVAARRALRGGIKRAFQNARALNPRSEFAAELRTRLRAHQQSSARRGFRFQGWWALAATGLLAVALGLAYRGYDRIAATRALARAAVGDHRNCALQFRLAEKPISLEEAARRYGVVYRVLERLPPDHIMTAVGPARVLERHACVYAGQRFAHVVLEYRNQRVSLLVAEVDGGSPRAFPDEARPHVTSGSRIDEMSVVSFRTSHHMVFLAGDIPQPELVALADAVAAPLSPGLAGA